MRENVRWFYLCLAATLGCAAAAQGFRQTQPAPAVVRAHSFELLDEAGRKRGEIGFDAQGQPRITLYDPSGRPIWSSGGVRAVPLGR